jgi:uncharacterized protein (TIGR02594 family)
MSIPDYKIHPWIDVAIQEIGVREIAGPRTNPRISEYLKTVGLFTGDETPWCSAFVNWTMQQAGYHGTSKANARSWLNWGIALDAPKFGAVVVFWRGDPKGGLGHVAFYVADRGDNVLVLGGNQSDMVQASLYPKSRILGYRWPVGG